MTERIEPGTYRSGAQFTVNPTTQAASDAVRALIQKRELESAELILAELGIEES